MGATPPFIFFLIYIFSLTPLFALRFKKSKDFSSLVPLSLSFLLTSGITYNTIGIFWSRAEFPPRIEREKLIYHSVSLSLRFSIRLVSLIPALS